MNTVAFYAPNHRFTMVSLGRAAAALPVFKDSPQAGAPHNNPVNSPAEKARFKTNAKVLFKKIPKNQPFNPYYWMKTIVTKLLELDLGVIILDKDGQTKISNIEQFPTTPEEFADILQWKPKNIRY